ncbi:hypothetical protein [Methylobacterium sp. J-076]|uniref:hypothetical protein n=1 Tax=Methylobacterium sp. J-076 TaxID=2836655 RepID=UPI001FB97B64|nr:hypothetical protein [Methylobacterium sp. J-076]MCJ2011244.1 hypothetical protein [Methylobacterium sp. J-076]
MPFLKVLSVASKCTSLAMVALGLSYIPASAAEVWICTQTISSKTFSVEYQVADDLLINRNNNYVFNIIENNAEYILAGTSYAVPAERKSTDGRKAKFPVVFSSFVLLGKQSHRYTTFDNIISISTELMYNKGPSGTIGGHCETRTQ